MRTFKQYVNECELKQADEIFESLDEGFWKGLGGAVDGSISGIGTLGKQFARGVGNTAIGLGQTAAGLGGVISGNRKGFGSLGRGLLRTGKGLGQFATAPIAALHRAYDAIDDPFSDMKVGGKLGQAMGVRSAPEPEEEPYMPPTKAPKFIDKYPQYIPPMEEPEIPDSPKETPVPPPIPDRRMAEPPPLPPREKQFNRMVRSYQKELNPDRRRDLLDRIKQEFPDLYDLAKKRWQDKNKPVEKPAEKPIEKPVEKPTYSRFLKKDKAAEYLGISEEELQNMGDNQQIRRFRDGPIWKYRVEDLDELINKWGNGDY